MDQYQEGAHLVGIILTALSSETFFLSGLCWVRGATVELPPAIKDPEWSRAFRLNATWNRRAAWFAGFGVIFASLASVVAVASVLGYR